MIKKFNLVQNICNNKKSPLFIYNLYLFELKY